MNSGQEISILSDDDRVGTSTSGWSKRRDILIKRSSPICRFRTEAFWNTQGLAAVLGKSQRTADVFIISIRAIGPRAESIDNDSTQALLNALKSLEITPVILQQQHSDTEWRNNWIVHINSIDVGKLPDYKNQHKGIFWNPQNEIYFFIWCVVPAESGDTENMKGRHLKFEAHIPNVVPWTDQILVGMRKELHFHTPDGPILSISDAKFRGEKIGDTIVNSGNLTITMNKLPNDIEFCRFIRNGRRKFLVAWWKGNEIGLTLDPGCFTCGADGHAGNCPYQTTLDNLIPQMNKLRSSKLTDQVRNLEVFNPPSKRKGTKISPPTNPKNVKIIHPAVARGKNNTGNGKKWP